MKSKERSGRITSKREAERRWNIRVLTGVKRNWDADISSMPQGAGVKVSQCLEWRSYTRRCKPFTGGEEKEGLAGICPEVQTDLRHKLCIRSRCKQLGIKAEMFISCLTFIFPCQTSLQQK